MDLSATTILQPPVRIPSRPSMHYQFIIGFWRQTKIKHIKRPGLVHIKKYWALFKLKVKKLGSDLSKRSSLIKIEILFNASVGIFPSSLPILTISVTRLGVFECFWSHIFHLSWQNIYWLFRLIWKTSQLSKNWFGYY